MIKYISQKLSIPERYLKTLSQQQLKNIKILVDLNKLKEARDLYVKYQIQNYRQKKAMSKRAIEVVNVTRKMPEEVEEQEKEMEEWSQQKGFDLRELFPKEAFVMPQWEFAVFNTYQVWADTIGGLSPSKDPEYNIHKRIEFLAEATSPSRQPYPKNATFMIYMSFPKIANMESSVFEIEKGYAGIEFVRIEDLNLEQLKKLAPYILNFINKASSRVLAVKAYKDFPLSKRAGEIIPFPTKETETIQSEPAQILPLPKIKQKKLKGFMDLTIDYLKSIIDKYQSGEMSAAEFASRLTYLAAETQEHMFDEPIKT